MRVKKGSSNVFTYFNVPAGATLTDLDLQYLRSGGTPSAKADATAGTVGAHSDNTAVYVDATDSPELLQVCFPDAAFATGVDEVILTVYNPAEGWQRDLRVELIDNTNKDIYDRLGAPAGASVSADIATVDGNVDSILVDTDEIQGKLPTNNIMGSAVKTDKDDEIDAIKAKTDALPADPASETNVNANETKIDAVQSDVTSILADTADMQPKLGTPAGSDMSADIAAVKADTAAIKTRTDNLPEGVKKNAALNNFMFLMVDTVDGKTPKTGLTVSGQRSIDGAAFGALANAATEIGSGWYKVDLAASDLNGDTVALLFTASGADARNVFIKTEV